MPVIITLIIAIFLILISWTWHNLGNIDKTKKILTIVISLILIFIVTFIVFNISKEGVQYESQQQMGDVQNVLVVLFTFINGLLIIPAIAKTLNKIFENEIDKNKAQQKFIIIFVIFIIIMIFECGYMKNIQQDILKIYNDALLIKKG